MDVIDRMNRSRMRSRIIAAFQLLGLLAFGSAFVWGYMAWRESANRTEMALARIEDLLGRGKPPVEAAVKVYSWVSATSFASASADLCDDTGSSTSATVCNWAWRPTIPTTETPSAVVERSLRSRLAVVIIASAGHDDRDLLPEARREFGTNFNLATRRAHAVLQKVMQDSRSNCEEPNMHCLVVPAGALAQAMAQGERLKARAPRLTIIVGG